MSEPTIPAVRSASVEASPTMLMVIQGRQLERRLEASFAELGLSLRTFGVLGHLRRSPGLSFSEVARRAGITAQSVQATMKMLEAAELIEVDGAGRGRRAEVVLTDLGRERMAAAFEIVAHIDTDVFQRPEWAGLGRELAAFARNARFPQADRASGPASQTAVE